MTVTSRIEYIRFEIEDMDLSSTYFLDEFMKILKNHPQFNRRQLRRAFQKQYMYLYRNDKQWLFDNLPLV